MTYAMTLDNSWELMSEDEMYDVNGGMTVGTLSSIINIAIAAASLVIAAVATYQTLHLAGMVSKGIVRNILTKTAVSALSKLMHTLLSIAGIAVSYSVAIVGFINTVGSELFNWSISGLIAKALDINVDGYVFN